MRFDVDGINLHHKFKISIKKPLGSKNSVINRVISKPIPALVGSATMGPFGAALGAGLTDTNANFASKTAEAEREQQSAADEAAAAAGDLEAMARLEEGKRQALGKQQQQQILGFADEQEKRGSDYRTKLAASLASTGRGVFERENPNILEDLNARGLFTSQTARDQEQGRLLKDIALNEQQQLSSFDTDQFNDISDIRGTGLSALLSGDQSALDSALELRKAGIQRRFDEADARKEQSYAEMLAKRQSRDNLIGGILGLGGSLGGGLLARKGLG